MKSLLQSIVLILLLGALLASSCTTQKAVIKQSRDLHTGAISVTPSWKVEKTFYGKNALWINAAVGGLVGYFVGVPSPQGGQIVGQNAALSGAAVGAGLTAVASRFFPTKTGSVSFQAGEEYDWLNAYNRQSTTSYTMLDARPAAPRLFLVPEQREQAFWQQEAVVNALNVPNNPSQFQITSVQISDENNDGTLATNESGSILVEIVNWDKVALKKVDIVVNLEGQSENLKLRLQKSPQGGIPAGSSATLVWQILPGFSETGGTFTSQATLTIEGQTIEKTSARFSRSSFFTSKPSHLPSKGALNGPRLAMITQLTGSSGQANYPSVVQYFTADKNPRDGRALLWQAILSIDQPLLFPNTDRKLLTKITPALVDPISEAAQGNDLEAQYLLAHCYYYGLGRQEDSAIGDALLSRSAQGGFAPALTARGLRQLAQQSPQAITSLQRAEEAGDRRALTAMALAYQNGLGTSPKKDLARAYYQRGQAAGLLDAYYWEAKASMEGKLGVPDLDHAIARFQQAAAAGDSWAMVELGEVYFNNNLGRPQDVDLALEWLNKAAVAENTLGMYYLASIFSSGELGYRDLNAAVYWAKKAALLGDGPAAHLLSAFYLNPDLQEIEYNEVLGRYWKMEAALLGEEVGDLGGNYHPLEGLLSNFELTPRVQITEYYDGRVEAQEYYDPFADAIGAGLMTFFQSRMPSGDILNDAVFAHDSAEGPVYAASLNNYTTTPVQVRAGQRITIEGRGRIKFGMFAGSGTANGLNDAGLAKYNRERHLPHGCLMMRIGENTPWQVAGTKVEFEAAQSGILQLAVNDKDSHNNENYFDVKITVQR